MTRLFQTARADLAAVRARRRVLRRASALFEVGSALNLSRPPAWSVRSQRAFAAVVRRLTAVLGVGALSPAAEEHVAVTARALLCEARRPAWRLLWSVSAVLALMTAVLLASAGVAALASPRARRWLAPPDLALDARWTTSSTFPDTPAAGTVPPHQEPFFFHTNSEDHPWIRFDLARAARVKKVRVEARTDCCSERTVPLDVEVPDGAGGWRLLCQRRVPFSTWSCDTGGVYTAVVRLRLAAQNMLHLSGVQLFE